MSELRHKYEQRKCYSVVSGLVKIIEREPTFMSMALLPYLNMWKRNNIKKDNKLKFETK